MRGGGAILIGERRLLDELFRSQPGNFAAPTVARGKGYHQNCRVAQSGEIITRTCCRAIFLARWQDHPDCRAEGLDRDGCWNLLQDQKIVTPIGIAEASNVERVFTSFDGAP